MKKLKIVLFVMLFGLCMYPSVSYAASTDYVVSESRSSDYEVGKKDKIKEQPTPTEKPKEKNVLEILWDSGKSIFKNNIVNFSVLLILFIVLAVFMHKNKKSGSETE